MQLDELVQGQALRAAVRLEPIDGPGGRIFPPTYAAPDKKLPPLQVVEELSSDERRVLIDSVASQANRQEEALVAARAAQVIDFADVYVDFSDTEAGTDRLSATELPHRLSDAILRDSEIDGLPFTKSDLGRRVLSATLADLSPILEASPTTLLFGSWFSQFGLARPLKLQRCSVGEIWAENAVLGKAVSSRIDPLGIEGKKIDLYTALEGSWTARGEEAVVSDDKPKPFGKKLSEIKHGNIPPSIREQGITAERVTLRWAMPLAAVRRLRFGGGERDAAGQVYVAALGVLARVLAHREGYSLRSRCDLIASGPLMVEAIDADGAVRTVEMTVDDALRLFNQTEERLRQAGFVLHKTAIARPGRKLAGLIKTNHEVQSRRADLTT